MSKLRFRRFSNFLEEVKWEQEHPEEMKKKWEEITKETIALIKKKK
jgi:hypothetical protein